MTIVLSENFRALFYAPFYAAHASGAFRRAGVEVELRPSSDPLEAARALRAGEVDVMWGGPLRVLIARDKDPASDLVCFCDVVARDPFFVVGRDAASGFQGRRSPVGEARDGFRGADAVGLPAGRSAARRRRSVEGRADRRQEHGRERDGVA
jgi:NitT/TauT family transport system substrate-binding protein